MSGVLNVCDRKPLRLSRNVTEEIYEAVVHNLNSSLKIRKCGTESAH